jgi:hypothetical protein
LAQLSAFEAHEILNPNATHPLHSQPDTNFIISTNPSSPAAQWLVDIISPTLPQTPVVLNHQLTVLSSSSHNTHSIIIRTKYHSVKHKKNLDFVAHHVDLDSEPSTVHQALTSSN